MFAIISFVFGILLAAIVLVASRQRKPERGRPTLKPSVSGWWTFIFGLIALVVFLLAALPATSAYLSGSNLWLISITLGFAAVVTGIGSLIRSDRHRVTWIGFIAGLIPAIFWIVFAAGSILVLAE